MVQGFSDQPVGIEFAAQRAKLGIFAGTEQGIGNPLRTAKTGNDSADGGDFYLRGGIANQKYFAVADLAFDRNPFAVNRDAGALPLDRLHILLFQEVFDVFLSLLTAAFADNAQRAARLVFRNQP